MLDPQGHCTPQPPPLQRPRSRSKGAPRPPSLVTRPRPTRRPPHEKANTRGPRHAHTPAKVPAAPWNGTTKGSRSSGCSKLNVVDASTRALPLRASSRSPTPPPPGPPDDGAGECPAAPTPAPAPAPCGPREEAEGAKGVPAGPAAARGLSGAPPLEPRRGRSLGMRTSGVSHLLGASSRRPAAAQCASCGQRAGRRGGRGGSGEQVRAPHGALMHLAGTQL